MLVVVVRYHNIIMLKINFDDLLYGNVFTSKSLRESKERRRQ
jgi:hypothetical protein